MCGVQRQKGEGLYEWSVGCSPSPSTTVAFVLGSGICKINPKSVWPGTLTASHTRRRTYLLSKSHLGVENCGTLLNSADVDNETDISDFAGVVTSPLSPGLALSSVCSCCRRRLLPLRVSFLSNLSSGALCCFTNTCYTNAARQKVRHLYGSERHRQHPERLVRCRGPPPGN